jgi:hypothetical protein
MGVLPAARGVGGRVDAGETAEGWLSGDGFWRASNSILSSESIRKSERLT